MRHIFRTFQSGLGDCITFRMEEGELCFNMLVDCGKLTDEIEEYVTEIMGGHIHLLIVTHIDADHIQGLITLLANHPELEIDRIIYNCGQETNAVASEPLDEETKKFAENVCKEINAATMPVTDGEVSAGQALLLAKSILLQPKWEVAWMQDQNLVTADSGNMTLPGGDFGHLVFLSPTRASLDKLEKAVRQKFNALFMKKMPQAIQNGESIYELLVRVLELENASVNEETLSASEDLSEQHLRDLANDKIGTLSDANSASLAFLWIKDEHAILFMGDADPRVVTENIVRKKVFEEKPRVIDLIKVSHHGSKHSTSKEQVTIVDSEHYFITGGNASISKPRPSIETIARIITASRPSGVSKREIHFNFQNNVFTQLQAATPLQQLLAFEVKGTTPPDNTYEFFT